MEHELKCWPEYYDAIERGDKPFELRKNDRHYHVGDTLLLRRWDPDTSEYTGREMKRKVTYLLDMEDVPFLPKKVYDWVILGLENTENAALRAELLQKTQELDMVENDKINAQMNLEHIEADLARYRTAESEGRMKMKPEPKFKIGELVRIVDAMDHSLIGRTGKIASISNYWDWPISYQLDVWGCNWKESMLESAQAALEAQGK